MKNVTQGFRLALLCCVILIAVGAGWNRLSAQTYCTPSFSFGANTFGNDFWITSVSFGSLSYTGGTALTSAPYYQLMGNTGSVTQGQTYTLTVTRNGAMYQDNMSVWIDWDQSGSPFTGSGEYVLNQTNPASGSNTYSTSVTVPFLATGTVRMRVMVNYFPSGSTLANTGCAPGNQSQGETKDFNITVVAGTPCSGAPAVASLSPASQAICSGSSGTFGLTGLAPASGYTYQWQQSGTSGSGFANATGTSTNQTYTTPTTLPFNPTYYRCVVTCTGSGLTTISNEGQATVNSFLNCYCIPTYAAANGGTRGIVLVSLNGSPAINNTTTVNTTAPYYTLYTAASPVSNAGLSLNTAYTLGVRTSTQAAASNNCRAWIDYNQNGIFEATESIGSFSNIGASITTNMAFTVPGTALTGVTAMRVRHRYGAAVATTDACTNFTGTAGAGGAGEIEDYRVNITGAACSGTPSAGTVAPATVSLCPNGTTVVSISGQTSGVSGITYQWQSATAPGGPYSNVVGGSGATTTSYTTAALANATNSPIHYYFKCLVTCTNGGATDIQVNPVDVTVNPTPSLSVSPASVSICNTSSPNNTVLTVSNASTGTTTYAWSPATGLSSTSGATVTANPAVTTTYTVTGTANGCVGNTNVTVTVNPGVVSISPSNPTIGIGGSVSLTASATSTNGGVTYSWSPSTGLNATTGPTVTANPLSTTTYTVTATDGSGCSRTGTVTVNVSSGTPGSVSCGYTYSYLGGSAWSTASSLGTPTVLGFSDDANYPNQSIGFNFTFNDMSYSTLGISSNGYIWFGTGSPSTTNYRPIGSATGQTGTVDGIVSVFGEDIYLFTGNNIRIVTTGTTPNRVCVVEWGSVGIDWQGGPVQEDFQIRLYETSNNIELWYRSSPYDLTFVGSNGLYGGQVGLRGSSPADFHTRAVACSNSAAWANSTLGNANSLAYIDGGWNCSGSGQWPNTGALYRYSPTPKPTITPTGQQTVCAGGAGVALTVNTNLPSPSYQWQTYTPPTNTDISGQTASTYLANPGAPGNYYYVARVTSGTCVRTTDATAVVAQSCCTGPSMTAAASPSAVCVGGSVALSSNPTGGNGCTGAYEYAWFNGSAYWDGSGFGSATPVFNGGYASINFVPAATATYTITARCDNNTACTSTSSAVVTVNSVTAATITASGPTTFCLPGTVTLEANVAASYLWSNGQTTQAITVGTSGSYSVTVTDANGCTSVAGPVVVTVQSAPTIVCPPSITLSNDGGFCGAIVNYSPATVTASPIAFLTYSVPPGSLFPVGTSAVLATATNVCGSVSCTFNITVLDNEAPVISCPPNQTVCAFNGGNSAVVTYNDATATDNCPGVTVVRTGGLASGSSFPVGNTVVTYRATDASGNTATCSFTVTVNTFSANSQVFAERIGAVSATTSITAYETANGFDNDNLTMLGTGDIRNTAPSSTIYYGGASGTGNVFLTNNTTAPAGNRTFEIAGINASNFTGMFLAWGVQKGGTNANLATGAELQLAYSIDNGATYTTVNHTPMPGSLGVSPAWTTMSTISPLPANASVSNLRLRFTNTHATVQFRLDDIILVGTTNAATITHTGTTSFCQGGGVNLVASLATSYLWSTGETTQGIVATTPGNYSVTVTGSNGCQAIAGPVAVSVYPQPSVSATSVNASCPGGANGSATALPSGGTSPYSYLWTPGNQTGITATGLGAGTYSVLLTDANGCTATSNTVTVTDNDIVAPVAVCAPFTVQLNGNGTGSVTAANVDGGSTDNCSVVSRAVSPNSFTCANVGANSVTLTVTDVGGNTATCTATVTVQDLVAPTAVCQHLMVNLDANGNGSITASQVNSGSTDNCGIASLAVTPTAFNCSDVAGDPVGLFISEYLEGSGNNKAIEIYNGTGAAVNLGAGGYAIATYSNGSTGISNSVALTGTVAAGDVYVLRHGAAVNSGIVAAADQATSNGLGWFNGDDAVALLQNSTVIDIIGQIGCQPNTAWDLGGNQTMDRTLVRRGFVTHGVNVNPAGPCGTGSFATLGSEWTGFPQDNTANLGSHTFIGRTNGVTLTVTDVNGNTATCGASVVVNDVTAPNAVCQNLTLQLNGSGSASTTAAAVNNGSTDACGIASLSLSATAFTCGNTGSNSVTLTVTDVNGNAATCTANVMVQDVTAPVVVCPANIAVSNDPGVCGAHVSYNATATDNCSATVALSPASGSLFAVGTSTVTAVATDPSGNTAVCSFTVTVTDNENPVIVCPANIVANNDPGVCGAAVTYSVTATDNCSATVSSSPASGSVFAVGVTAVSATAVDPSNNSATCSFTVTVVDNENPVIVCPANISVSAATGQCAQVVSYAAPVGTDNCGGATTAQIGGLGSGSSFPVGVTTNAFQVTDASLHTATCSFTVTVTDNQAPVISCPPNQTVCAFNGGNSAVVTYNDATAIDNCPGVTVVRTGGPASGSSFPVGNTVVTYRATDASGNTSTCSFTVTVNTFSANSQVFAERIGAVSATTAITAYETANGFDNDNLTMSGNGDIRNTAPSSSTYYGGASGTGNVFLTNNTTAPAGNRTFEIAGINASNFSGMFLAWGVQKGGTGSNLVTGSELVLAYSIDNGATYTTVNHTPMPGSTGVSPAWSTMSTLAPLPANASVSNLRLRFTNTHATVQFRLDDIILVGTTNAATITHTGTTSFCQGGSVNLVASLATSYLWSTGETTQNIVVTTPGNYSVTVTGSNGCQAIAGPVAVSVYPQPSVSATSVNASCPGGTNGSATALPSGGTSPYSYLWTPGNQTGITATGLGAGTYSVQLTDANGCTAMSNTVTVTDNDIVAPVAVCTSFTTSLNSGGTATITAANVDGGSTDNCSIVSRAVSPNSFSCANVGSNSVILTVTDVGGNTATCTATVTVQDLVAPTAVCQNLTVNLDGSGNASVTASQVNNGSTDNCGIASLAVTPNTFNCADVQGDPVGLFISEYLEGSGNNKAIEIYNGTGAAVNLGAGGYAIATYSNGSTGISSSIALTGTVAAGDVYVLRHGAAVNPGIIAAADQVTANGLGWFNGDDAVVLVQNSTVIDIIGQIGCQPNATWDLGGNQTMDRTLVRRSFVTSGVSVNPTGPCGTGSFATLGSQWTGFPQDNTANLGSHSFIARTNGVTLTVTDVNGNTASCGASVVVNDVTAPNAVCQDLTLQLDGSGNASTTAAAVNNGSTDACGIASLSLSATAFTCANTGSNAVTLTVTDVNGNAATCAANVTVQDVTAPVITCPASFSQNTDPGVCGAVVNFSVTATDNCSATVSSSPASGSVFGLGLTTVNAVATDPSGNSATCSFTVTVSDNENPTITCPANISVSNDAGQCSAVVSYTVSSSDNCGSMVTSSPASGSVFAVGITTVNATAADFFGNTAVCSFSVTVSDDEDPQAVCTDVTVVLGTDDLAHVAPGDVDAGSSDNCIIDHLSLSIEEFSCQNVGQTTVVLSVYDANGNVGTCSATVTTLDQTAPVANCQDITVSLDANGAASIQDADIDGGSTDNCQLDGVQASVLAFDCGDLGANAVVLTVSDGSGNTAACTATVTVEDNLDPAIVCPANVTISHDPNACGAVVNYATPTGTDNCSVATVGLTSGLASGSLFPIGSTTVTWTATDGSGNTATCSFDVNVSGVNVTANDFVTVGDANNTGGNCFQITPAQNNRFGAIWYQNMLTLGSDFSLEFDLNFGTNDANGADGLAFVLQPVNTGQGSNGGGIGYLGITPSLDVEFDTWQNTQNNDPAADHIGINKHGNTSHASGALVAPVTLPNIEDGANHSARLVWDATATKLDVYFDNVLRTSLTQDIATTLFGGSPFVYWGWTGATGGSVNDQRVCVGDLAFSEAFLVTSGTSSPETCPGAANGSVNVTVIGGVPPYTYLWSNGATTEDLLNVSAGNYCLTVTDHCGNTATTCVSVALIPDVTAPVVTCPANITTSNNPGECQREVNYDVTATDNCTMQGIVAMPGSGYGFPVGTTTVTSVATDASGNTSSCTFTVTVNDTEAPVITCPANVSVAGNTGSFPCTGTAIYTAPVGTDNCAGATTVLTGGLASGSSFPQGNSTVTFTVTDASGNTASCSFTVTVGSCNRPPVAVCQNITVNANANCQGTATAAQFNGGSSDPDGNALTYSVSPAGPYALGTTTVVLTVSDGQLTSTCTATVTVRDVTPPAITCPANRSVVAGTNCTAVVTYPIATATDNCGSAAVVRISGPASGATFPVGVTTVVFRATDLAGNSSTCSFTVTVTSAPMTVALTSPLNGCGYNVSACCNSGGGNGGGNGGSGSGSGHDGSGGHHGSDHGSGGHGSGSGSGHHNNWCSDRTCYNFGQSNNFCGHGSLHGSICGNGNGSHNHGSCCGRNCNHSHLSCNHCGHTHGNCGQGHGHGGGGGGNLPPCGHDGSATATVTGGCAPYTYHWSTGATTATLTGLTPGLYVVTVTDAGGHATVQSIVLTQASALALTATGTNVSCYGSHNGSATAVATGGCAPYTYTWSNGSHAGTINNLNPGTYRVTVTDGKGCTATASVTVTQPGRVVADAGAHQVVYPAYAPRACATLNGTASGGTPGYTYRWTRGGSATVLGTSANLSVCPTVTTVYYLLVTDSKGCTGLDSVAVCPRNVSCGSNMIQVCHNAPGRHGSMQTLCVSSSTVASHLNHGDELGACGSTANCNFPRTNQGGGYCGPNKGTEAQPGVAEEPRELSLRAFPNPTNGVVTVEMACRNCVEDGVYTLRLTDVYGKEILLSDVPVVAGEGTIQLDLGKYSAGVYLITVTDGETRLVERVVRN